LAKPHCQGAWEVERRFLHLAKSEKSKGVSIWCFVRAVSGEKIPRWKKTLRLAQPKRAASPPSPFLSTFSPNAETISLNVLPAWAHKLWSWSSYYFGKQQEEQREMLQHNGLSPGSLLGKWKVRKGAKSPNWHAGIEFIFDSIQRLSLVRSRLRPGWETSFNRFLTNCEGRTRLDKVVKVFNFIRVDKMWKGKIRFYGTRAFGKCQFAFSLAFGVPNEIFSNQSRTGSRKMNLFLPAIRRTERKTRNGTHKKSWERKDVYYVITGRQRKRESKTEKYII